MKTRIIWVSLLLFIINISNAQVPSYVPTNGLMGYWSFNGNANDESINGNNATINGASVTADRFGNINSAYEFIENSDMISIPNTSINPQDFTISAWCKLNSPFIYTTFSIIEIANLDFTTIGGIGLHVTQNDDVFGANNYKAYAFAGNFENTQSNILNYDFISNWNHFVVIKQNNIISLYINNQIVSSQPVSQTTNYDNAWLQIGSRHNINENPLSSRTIDDIGIWNRTLTADEAMGLFNTQENTCETLVINSGPLGFNPPTYASTVTIYPNPAQDQITIDCGNLATVSGWTIKIINSLGQEVFNGAMNTQQYTINLNGWGGTGLYFVKIYNESNVLMNTKKILLQ